MMTSRDQEQYSDLLRRIAPHCKAVPSPELGTLLSGPPSRARAAHRERIFWSFARYAAVSAMQYKQMQYGCCGAPCFEDLASVSFSTLLQAIDTFDGGRSSAKSFPSYLRVCMRRALSAYVRTYEHIVRRPLGGPMPTPPIVVSIDELDGGSEDQSPADKLAGQEVGQIIDRVLDRSRHRRLICSRFGMYGLRRRTETELAGAEGITKQAISARIHWELRHNIKNDMVAAGITGVATTT